MNKFSILVACVFAGMLSTSLFAQQLKYCGSSEANQKMLQENPQGIQQQEELEQYTQQYSKNFRETQTGTTYTIPIVFHIIHQNGPENISDAQIKDEMRILNEDYSMLNPDTTDVVASFQGLRANAQFQFRLAEKDPNGNCTNGIDRIYSSLTNNAGDNSKLNDWPSNRYLNVWVVDSIAGNAAGYAYLPGVSNPKVDGILILSQYIGSIGTSSPITSRALTHEIGHFFNLMHPWGPTNSPGVACGDDNVTDTPETKGWTTCNLKGAICNPPVIENVQNYMDYSYCSNMFTKGQVQRMRAAITSSVGYRSSLWSASNLAFCGINGTTQAICTADFNADQLTVCAGTTVNFSDLSWNGPVNSWNWTFTGGSPASSTQSAPAVQYNTAGMFPVSLSVSNSLGGKSITKNSYLAVYGAAKYANSYYHEGFEWVNSFNNDWLINNLTSGSSTWQLTSAAASTGTFSLEINNFNGALQGDVEEAITPSIDLTQIPAPVFTFKYACAAKTTSSSDELNIYVSNNCGMGWTLRKSISGATLYSAPEQTTSFTPSAGQWKQQTVNILPYLSDNAVLFKFQFKNGGGNNIYIDDINIGGANGINQESISTLNLSVSPNPLEENSVLSFTLIDKKPCKHKAI